MKKIKYLIVLVSLFFADFYGMEFAHPVSSTAQVQTYFVPQDREAVTKRLISLLDSANRQVLIAMYWITSDVIVNKLILLKQRGIDVQVIFDETSDKSIELMDRLLNNNILPIIFPSKWVKWVIGANLMHNKFLVVDDGTVLTGSANFTKTAFDPTSQYSNYENIIILYSEDIAQKFRQAFFEIENNAFELYIKIIADNPADLLPGWINRLIPVLYQANPRLKEVLGKVFGESQLPQKQQIDRFFKDLRPWEPVTLKQKAFLEYRRVSTGGMSKQGAYNIIEIIKRQEEQY